MGKNILLIQLSHRHVVHNGFFTPLPSSEYSYAPQAYPLGLGYLSNAIKNAGYSVSFIDLWAHPEHMEDLRDKVKNADICGISFYVTQYKQLEYIVKIIKSSNPAVPVVVGGPGAGVAYKVILDNLPVDFLVFGEAEVSFIELVYSLFNGKDIKRVDGIAFRNRNDKTHTITEVRKYIQDLDGIPFPDRECLDFNEYSKSVVLGGKKLTRVANVITGRGCPYECTFCSKTFKGLRQRSVSR